MTKKELLLENAERLFHENGFYNTTVEEITKESGVAKGTFYTYFKAKEDILVYFLNRRLIEVQNQIRRIRDFDMPLEKKIKYIIKETLMDAFETPQFFLMKLKFLNLKQENETTELKAFRHNILYTKVKIVEDILMSKQEELSDEVKDRVSDLAVIFYNMLQRHIYNLIVGGFELIENVNVRDDENFKKRVASLDIEAEVEFLYTLYCNGIIKK